MRTGSHRFFNPARVQRNLGTGWHPFPWWQPTSQGRCSPWEGRWNPTAPAARGHGPLGGICCGLVGGCCGPPCPPAARIRKAGRHMSWVGRCGAPMAGTPWMESCHHGLTGARRRDGNGGKESRGILVILSFNPCLHE
jgi:hypothetical protein